jgi:Na+:H+ antiporter, NhaA family
MKRLAAVLQSEAGSALPLLAAAVLALLLANSPLAWVADQLLGTKFTVAFGTLGLSKPLLLWINDGLMAVFFLLVGLEIKREVVEGELSRPAGQSPRPPTLPSPSPSWPRSASGCRARSSSSC